MTILGLFIAYAIPIDPTRYEEAGKPVVKIKPIEAIKEPKVELASEVSTIETKPAVAPVNASYSGSGDQYLDYIISHESGGCAFKWQGEIGGCPAYHGVPSDYSGLGYGLCQSTPPSKMASAGADWATNPDTQIQWCKNYALARYGSTYAAYAHWLSFHNW